MRKVVSSRWLTCALVVVASLAIACADNGPGREPSPLDGLTKISSVDSGGGSSTPNTPAPGDTGYGSPPSDTGYAPPPSPTPGFFRGFVRGQAEPGTGPDTMANAPKLANVRVTVYPRVHSGPDPVSVGSPVASLVTDANGEFQTPVLPGGEYVVTFVPPEGSIYRGVYATARAHSQSGNYPWWVVLSKK